MISSRTRLFRAAEWLFLIAITLLIVRANEYPWPIKRASDICILLSGFAVVALISYTGRWRDISTQIPTGTAFAVTLFLGGLVAAMVIAPYSPSLSMFHGENLLAVGRYGEAVLILLLAIFFARVDSEFPRKALCAQLSTLTYLLVLCFPNAFGDPGYRFQLFENWPSNVSYYLLVSLSTLFAFSLTMLVPIRKSIFPLGLASAGTAGIFLWTQSRASWLGAIVGGIVLFSLWIRYYDPPNRVRAFFTASIWFLAILLVGWFLLPRSAQNNVLVRIFPSISHVLPQFSFTATDPQDAMSAVLAQGLSPALGDDHRLILWKIFFERFRMRPWGYGPNYPTVDIGAGAQGPHNTPLEILAAGGALSFVGFCILIILAGRNQLLALTTHPAFNPWNAALLTALVGLLVAAFFDNMATFRLFWLVLGLSLSGKPLNIVANRPLGRESRPPAELLQL